jgi:carboxyl-terminal processing protease
LRIRSFGEKTIDELDEALSGLEERGLDGLVLDLRANHGGMLSAGVYATGRFLESGSSVVSHRGRASRERSYDASPGQTVAPYPMTVLVDCRSASAAEILAGALQDHDRALIVGSNTFGKGLVQSVYNLDDGAGMVLTTARYYTPSGRLIQRTYDGLDTRTYHADPCNPDFEAEHIDAKQTTAGRVVYGGGGITPDVKLPGPTETALFRAMRESRAFERYAERIAGELKPLPHDWDLDGQTLAGFRRFVQSERLEIDESEFQQSRIQIERALKAAIYTVVIDLDAGERVLAELDPDVRRAVELMPQAAALLRSGATD